MHKIALSKLNAENNPLPQFNNLTFLNEIIGQLFNPYLYMLHKIFLSSQKRIFMAK